MVIALVVWIIEDGVECRVDGYVFFPIRSSIFYHEDNISENYCCVFKALFTLDVNEVC